MHHSYSVLNFGYQYITVASCSGHLDPDRRDEYELQISVGKTYILHNELSHLYKMQLAVLNVLRLEAQL